MITSDIVQEVNALSKHRAEKGFKQVIQIVLRLHCSQFPVMLKAYKIIYII